MPFTFLKQLLAKMGVEAEVVGTADEETITETTGADLGVLIWSPRADTSSEALQYSLTHG